MQLRNTIAFVAIAAHIVFAAFATTAKAADNSGATLSTTSNANAAKVTKASPASPSTGVPSKRKPRAIARNMDDLSDGNYRVKAETRTKQKNAANTTVDAKIAPRK